MEIALSAHLLFFLDRGEDYGDDRVQQQRTVREGGDETTGLGTDPIANPGMGRLLSGPARTLELVGLGPEAGQCPCNADAAGECFA